MYFLILNDLECRTTPIDKLKIQRINAVFQNMPLHSSSMGSRLGRVSGSMHHTESLSARLVTLPFWIGVEQHQTAIIREVTAYLEKGAGD